MKVLRPVMVGVLVLSFGGAWMVGACGSNEPGPSDSCATPADAPTEDTPADCIEPMPGACMRYRIPLQGDPNMNLSLRQRYIDAFGSACYLSDAANPTFNCFYKTWEDACAKAVKIGKVSGNAPYEEDYKCQPVGDGNYTLQVGLDPANKITISYEDAPRQTPRIDVKSVPTEVSGPYRNLVEVTTVIPGKRFNCTSGQVGADGKTLDQRRWVLEVNRKANKGEIHSDLAGFTWPCKDENCKPTTCTEELVLKDPNDQQTPDYDPGLAEVHHVVPMKDARECAWGTNAYKNAAVISRRLNIYLSNMEPPVSEVLKLNNAQAYTP